MIKPLSLVLKSEIVSLGDSDVEFVLKELLSSEAIKFFINRLHKVQNVIKENEYINLGQKEAS
jgi:hypothetical protein